MVGTTVNSVLGIINKFIPDKSNQLQAELELTKLEVEDYTNKKGSHLEKVVTMVFPTIAFTFCAYLISNLIGMWIGFIFKIESPIFPVDEDLYKIIMIYLAGFFGNRSVKSWKEGH